MSLKDTGLYAAHSGIEGTPQKYPNQLEILKLNKQMMDSKK